jgi:YidC/Oxa1 family membrane protein insertase
MSSRQTSQANPQAQMIQKVFPIMFGVISLNIPAGVVVYFIVSNLFRIGQQALMYRYDPQLSAVVRAEVKEVEAKATEMKKHPGPQPRGSNGQGNRNRSRSKKKRRGR